MGAIFSNSFNPQKDIPSLEGKVYLVTGGNSGIGMYTILHLARRGATVYMGARNENKAKASISQLKSEGLAHGNGRIIYHYLDLSDPRLAKKSAQEFLSREQRLDGLGPLSITKDGVIQGVVTNHISPFVFTNELLPLMKKTAQEPGSDVRIVNVSSYAHTLPASQYTKFDSKESLNVTFGSGTLDQMRRYGITKLMNVLHINELQRRLDTENVPIICISLHPGGVQTPGLLEGVSKWRFGSFLKTIAGTFLKSSSDGALTSTFAAAAPVVRQWPEKYRGAYLEPYTKIASKRKEAQSKDSGKELWNTTEKIVDEMGL
ncbi:NAD-P-binding protein [Sistotremastrum niveocremeum HHB9708]|uniref:NAD-P-binding protein n=1 Tax=Sistotremastrum niveocremeum HHB9708 TaxID=1314777 RepID=A0A164NAI2_9AGAM|nr:NAD-P-binding protein [Sistotremastrum niveocremeum HHB9708]